MQNISWNVVLRTRIWIIISVFVIGSASIFATLFYFQGISLGEKQDMCIEKGGKWDLEHDTCDRIDLISCTLMSGTYQECKSHELRCPLNDPYCGTTDICIHSCLFEQTTRAKTMTEKEKRIINNFLSPSSETKNCRDFLGKPDGECFVKSYDNCESAIIQHSHHSVEGDPIFFYAQILPDSCMVLFVIDDRYDKHGSNKAITERMCRDAQLLDNNLNFQCGDDEDRYGFPLK